MILGRNWFTDNYLAKVGGTQDVAGERLIDNGTAIRPTRTRLLAAMCISACCVAVSLASLGSLVEFARSISNPSPEHEEPLTVHIKKDDVEADAGRVMPKEVVRPSPKEPMEPGRSSEVREEVAADDSAEPPDESQPEKDWSAIAVDAARARVDAYVRQEETRDSMWRSTASVMFQPAGEKVAIEWEPVLSDIRFKQRSRVLGLGINLGSCFFGIPVAGVPVEDRSVGISVIVCRQDSG